MKENFTISNQVSNLAKLRFDGLNLFSERRKLITNKISSQTMSDDSTGKNERIICISDFIFSFSSGVCNVNAKVFKY